MSALGVAEARRGNEVRRLHSLIDQCDSVIRTNGNGPAGQRSDYLVERVRQAAAEKKLLEDELMLAEGLSGDELVKVFCPEASRPAPEVPRLRDALARGEYQPSQIVVHRDAPPVRHEGPATGPVLPTAAPSGQVYTYDGQGNLIPIKSA